VNRSDHTPLPTRLRVVGATDLERRVLDAAARELPSVELTEKMQKALGISLAAGALAAAAKATAAGAKVSGAASPAFAWPAISVGVLALAVTGAVVGLRSNANHHAANTAAATALSPAPAVAPIITTPATAAPAFSSLAVAAPAVAAPAVAAPTPVLVAPATERPAAAVVVHARHHRTVARASELRAEIALVDAARTAVATGADDRALALLQRYDASYPGGTFRPEAAALRIEALDHLGRTAQARTLASKFIATHADSPLADRVARLTGVPAR
jgi:hypothetical protein